MNWKRLLKALIGDGLIYLAVKKFISTEIITKLIEDIPNNHEHGNCYLPLKQQLRNKWL